MEFLVLLILLAINYNQGAARPEPEPTKDGLTSEMKFAFPKRVEEHLTVTIVGTIKTNSKLLEVELPLKSGKENCQIKIDFENNIISTLPAVEGDTPGELVPIDFREPVKFFFRLIARRRNEQDMFSIIFDTNDEEQNTQLNCRIDSFEDVDNIVIKSGVERVDSLLFEFKNR